MRRKFHQIFQKEKKLSLWKHMGKLVAYLLLLMRIIECCITGTNVWKKSDNNTIYKVVHDRLINMYVGGSYNRHWIDVIKINIRQS